MPYLPIYHIQPGSYLGHTIYDDNGMALLWKGDILSQTSLQVLVKKGIKRLYVYEPDEVPADVRTILSANIREKAIQLLDEIFLVAGGHGDQHAWNHNVSRIGALVYEMQEYFQERPLLTLDLTRLKSVNHYMVEHSLNVGIVSGLLARNLGLTHREVGAVLKAGLLHDIGKVYISPDILYKPGNLSPEELREIEKHPGTGYRLLIERYAVSPDIGLGSLLHHERWNGSGYPYHLRKEDIHLYGRIIAVADVFDAMTSERVYRQSVPYTSVLEHLEKQAGICFDPDVISVMQRIIYPFSVENSVTFATGTEAGAFPRIRNRVPVSPFPTGIAQRQVSGLHDPEDRRQPVRIENRKI